MSKRSSSGSSIIGAIVVAALVVWVLSKIWVYLLLSGAVVLVGWVGWTLVRTFGLPSIAPRLTTAQTPRLAPPPEEQYRVLVPVDRKVFDEPRLAETSALKVFAAWAHPLAMAPADLSGLVRSLELRTRRIGRLSSEVAERHATWREIPGTGSAAPTGANVSLDSIDLWSASVETLRSTSRHIASCGKCSGEGHGSCGSCGGTTRAVCAGCNGAGKAYGIASNGSRRLMNCKECRGKKEVPCTACTKGQATCATCRGSGRLERWIEVEEKVRYDVQIEPDGEMTRAYRWGQDGVPATRDEIEADAKIVTEVVSATALTHDDIAKQVAPDWIAAHWQKLQPKLNPKEHIRKQSFWLLEVPSIELSYTLGSSPPTIISFEGLRMLAPPASLDKQFEARARKIRRIRPLLIGFAAAVPLAYLIRGAYFWNLWVAALALCMAAVLIAVDGFLRESTLGRPSTRRWSLAVAVGAALVCGLAIGTEPSARAAKRHIGAGNFERAKTELAALDTRQDGSYASLWADLRLAEMLKGNDLETVLRQAAQIPESLPQRAAANRHVFDVLSHHVLESLSAGKTEPAEAALTQVSATFQGTSDGRTYASQMAELRAQANDAKYDQCKTDICRLRSALDAMGAAATTARQQRVNECRGKLSDSMVFREQPNEPVQARLQRLRQAGTVAQAIEEQSGDNELITKARPISQWVREERGKTPILGSDRDVAAELLSGAPVTNPALLKTTLGHIAVYATIRDNRCTGLYLVGDEKDSRELNDAAHAGATAQILAQAFGRKVELPALPRRVGARPATIVRLNQAGTTVIARWRGSSLIELRIGESTP